MTKLIDQLAQKIWDYHHLNHQLKKADCLLVCGSHDVRVAERGAELFLAGWAPMMVFAGGLGRHTNKIFAKTEADTFAEIAINMGVPKDRILIENRSSNTGKNILLTQKLLEEKRLKPQKIIVVHKPYMERRTYATAKKLWPNKEIAVTSPLISFSDYPTENIPKNEVINIMVGDLQRIKIYSKRGYQITHKIPKDVWQAYKKLVNMGYDKELI